MWDAEKLTEADQTARHEINEILRRYILAYSSFERVGRVVLGVLLVLINSTIFAVGYNWQTRLSYTLVACAVSTVVVLYFAKVLAVESYPSPAQLMDLDYLVSHFSNIHPDSLIRLLNIGVHQVLSDGRRQFVLSCGIHLTGYKFFLVMANEDESKHYLVAYGKVSSNTRVEPIILQEHYQWDIPVGNLDPQWPSGLDLPVFLHLLVFVPMPVGWKDYDIFPYSVRHEPWIEHPGEPGRYENNARWSVCDPRSRDSQVRFRRKKDWLRESWEITLINVDANKSNYRLRKLLWHFKRELENSADITTLSGKRVPPLEMT